MEKVITITKEVIDQKPRSDYRLILFSNRSHIIPHEYYSIESRKKFLFWNWWSSVIRRKDLRIYFILQNESYKDSVSYNENKLKEAKYSLSLFRKEIPRYVTTVIDQRD